jgi:hypothetical protein
MTISPMAGSGVMDVRQRFFFEKKKQKTFGHGGGSAAVPIKPNRRLGLIGTESSPPPGPKVYLVLFLQKKNVFP